MSQSELGDRGWFSRIKIFLDFPDILIFRYQFNLSEIKNKNYWLWKLTNNFLDIDLPFFVLFYKRFECITIFDYFHMNASVEVVSAKQDI